MSTTRITVTPDIVGGAVASVSFTALTNADTGAALSPSPALPQPFTDNGDGTWGYTLTNLPGVAVYDVAFTVTLTGGQVVNGHGTKLASLVAVSGCDATETDLDNWYGAENVTAWSDLSSANARNTDRIATALAYARDEVASFFSNGPYLIQQPPLSVFSYTDAAGMAKVVKWETVIAAAWLVGRRWMGNASGGTDTGPSITVNADLATVMAEMREHLAGGPFRLNAALVNAAKPTCPTIVTEGRLSGGCESWV